MDNPLYDIDMIIGGAATSYSANKILGLRIHDDQSFVLRYTFTKEDLSAFSVDGATSVLKVSAYKGSGYVPVVLVSGVHTDSGSGTVDRVTFTVPSDAIPSDIATFPLRNPGNAVFYAIITDGAGKKFEVVAEVNIFDADYSLTGEAAPSSNIIIPKANDLGTVESLIVSTPPTPTLNIAYIVGPSGTGDWSGQDDNLAIGTGTAWIFFTPVEGSFIYDKNTNVQYVFDTAWISTNLDSEQVAAGTDNNQVGTAYTLLLSDKNNKTVTMTNAAANVVTIPLNASVAFPIGTKIPVMQYGAGITTSTGDTGVTVNNVSAGSVAASSQFNGMLLHKIGTDTWAVSGG